MALLCVVLLGTVAYSIRRAHAPLAFVTIGILALLVSPTSWSNHWVWVVPGLLLMISYAICLRSTWWLALAMLTGMITLTAPFKLAPAVAGQELAWTPWQHLVGNSYLVLGALMLVLFGLHGLSRAHGQGLHRGVAAKVGAT